MKQARYIISKSRPNAPHQVWYYSEDGKRHAKNFAKYEDAFAFLQTCNEEQKTPLPDQLVFSVQERIVFAQIKALCAKNKAPIENALKIVEKYLHTSTVSGHDIEEASKSFLADCEKRGCRSSSLDFYESKINLFVKRTRKTDIADISKQDAETYFASINSPEHAKRALRAFFNFCIKKKWISSNPFATAPVPRKLKEKYLPSVLSVNETKSLLTRFPPVWQPTFALMAFCGIRPNEILAIKKPVMRIEDIDFANKKIMVRAEIAKTRTMRLFTPPDNIWAWIEPLKKRNANENVAPGSYDAFKGVKKRLGIKLEKDVLRHSFGSYGFHFLGAEQTIEIMGHVGDLKVFFKHYKGLSDIKSATEYFSIAPQK